MSFVLCSGSSEKGIASISFSGNNLSSFGFEAGCRVSVDISKGQIFIKSIDEMSTKCNDNKCFERK
jgi:hypothetical protein